MAVALNLAPATTSAHPADEGELWRELQEQYGRPSDKEPEEEIEEPAAPPPPPMLSIIGSTIVLGYKHILPSGIDHILFVLGLFFASTQFRPLLIQVSSFTVAHTVTLALASLGLVELPANIVNPLIALSIAYVAIENILFHRMTLWRPFIVFGFGLLHGLGFASAFIRFDQVAGQDTPGLFFPRLISFNIGVELGQLSILLIAYALMHWFYERKWYDARVRIPISLLIAAVGIYWVYEAVTTGTY